MKSIQLSVALVDAEVLAGCALRVVLTLTNTATGSACEEVQEEGTDLPFEYEVRDALGTVLRVSKERFESQLHAHPGPPSDPIGRLLAPGQSVTFEDDVAAWMPSPLAAGDYTLTVCWRAIDGDVVTAEPIALRVLPLQPLGVASAVDSSGQYLTTLVAHAGQGLSLLERRSAYGRPDFGRGLVRHRTALPIEGLAVATEVDQPVDWRRIAWLEAGALRVATTWGNELLNVVDVGRPDLEQPTLLPQGFQTADGSALFVLVGARAGMGACVLVVLAKGLPPQQHVFDLGAPPPALATVGYFVQAQGVLELVRADVSGDQVRIAQQRIELARPGYASPLRPLLQTSGPLRALAMAPLLRASPVVDAVLGDVYYRLPLLGGTGALAWPLEPFPTAQAWSIASVAHPDAPVLAQVGSALWVARASKGPSWSRLVERVHGIAFAQMLHLAEAEGATTRAASVAWVDGRDGYTVQTLDD